MLWASRTNMKTIVGTDLELARDLEEQLANALKTE
jgi:hypothetical protein